MRSKGIAIVDNTRGPKLLKVTQHTCTLVLVNGPCPLMLKGVWSIYVHLVTTEPRSKVGLDPGHLKHDYKVVAWRFGGLN